MKDMKEGLTSARKADTTHVRKSLEVYIARPCEWGSVKYERGNFLRPVGDRTDPAAATRADFERFRAYLRAAKDHISDALDSMEHHLAVDPKLEDVAGMKRAAYAEDTDAKPGCPYGHSGLPHVAPAAASLMMAIEQATLYGLLPADPGQPWAERSQARPLETLAAERARVLACGRTLPEISAEVAAEAPPSPPAQGFTKSEEEWFAGVRSRAAVRTLIAKRAYHEDGLSADERRSLATLSDADLLKARWQHGECAVCGAGRGDRNWFCDECCEALTTEQFSAVVKVVDS